MTDRKLEFKRPAFNHVRDRSVIGAVIRTPMRRRPEEEPDEGALSLGHSPDGQLLVVLHRQVSRDRDLVRHVKLASETPPDVLSEQLGGTALNWVLEM